MPSRVLRWLRYVITVSGAPPGLFLPHAGVAGALQQLLGPLWCELRELPLQVHEDCADASLRALVAAFKAWALAWASDADLEDSKLLAQQLALELCSESESERLVAEAAHAAATFEQDPDGSTAMAMLEAAEANDAGCASRYESLISVCLECDTVVETADLWAQHRCHQHQSSPTSTPLPPREAPPNPSPSGLAAPGGVPGRHPQLGSNATPPADPTCVLSSVAAVAAVSALRAPVPAEAAQTVQHGGPNARPAGAAEARKASSRPRRAAQCAQRARRARPGPAPVRRADPPAPGDAAESSTSMLTCTECAPHQAGAWPSRFRTRRGLAAHRLRRHLLPIAAEGSAVSPNAQPLARPCWLCAAQRGAAEPIAPSQQAAHARTEHGAQDVQEDLTCSKCGDSFLGAAALDQHCLRMHGGPGLRSRSAACRECGLRFSDSRALAEHEDEHMGVVPTARLMHLAALLEETHLAFGAAGRCGASMGASHSACLEPATGAALGAAAQLVHPKASIPPAMKMVGGRTPVGPLKH